MLGLGTIGEFAIGEQSLTVATAEFIGPDKYMQAFGLPVRFKPGVKAGSQQFSFLPDAFPFVSFGWFEELSKPAKLTKSGLKAAEQQFIALQPAPSPFVATGWFNWLSEPQRQKRGLRPSLQQFTANDTAVIPVQTTFRWLTDFAVPQRQKSGLRAALQQFLATPSRLLPTPTIFGILDATETRDRFVAGATEFNRPVDGELGVQERDRNGETGVSTAVAPISARMSIHMI